MYSRPKPGESEEDILRLQQEFEKNKAENKVKLAAKVISNTTQDKPTTSTSNVECIDNSSVDITEQLANTFEAIPSNSNLKNIVERNSEHFHSSFKFNTVNKGFPQAKRRDLSITSSKGGSIFAQQMKKLKKDTDSSMEVDNVVINENPSTNSKNFTANLPMQSYILSGSEGTSIHEENLNIMKNMTEEELIEEKEKLMSMMDPAIVQFLRSKRNKAIVETTGPSISEQNEVAEDIKIEEIATTSEILNQPLSDNWLNFNVVETNKLAWMRSVDIPKLKAEKFEARFDFEGFILPYSQSDINEKNRLLYHHGEDPGRPGYTLQELLQLSRSSVLQQKIIALNSIANILSLNSSGIYDDIIDLPLEQIFFVIRFCLDDNTPSILNASVKAMRNLVYSEIDETCLDGLLGFGLGFVQPVLAVDHELDDDNTINDQQLVEKNIVKCLARTEILTRIRYIINTVKPPLETIVYCIEILIRLSRDSEFLLKRVMETENLIGSIVSNFIPQSLDQNASSSPYGVPLIQAVKLFRVISSRSKALAETFINKYKILDSLVLYLSNDTFSSNVNGLRLQTECFHSFSLLIHYNLALDYFSILQPVLMSTLNYHFETTNISAGTTYVRLGHAAGLLGLLSRVAARKCSLVAPYLPLLIRKCSPKWVAQLCASTEYSCGKLTLVSSLVRCLAAVRSCERIEEIDASVLRLIDSEGFSIITDRIESGSMLLYSRFESVHKSSSNLKGLEVACWSSLNHVVPLMQANSCLPFLHSVSSYVDSTDHLLVKKTFLNHPNVQKYLKALQTLDKYHLSDHWFAKPETAILMNILRTSVDIRSELDTSIFYELAVKCLCVFNAEQKADIKYVLENIIFCSKFYPSEVFLRQLDLNQRTLSLETSLNNLPEILEVYTQVLGLQNETVDLSNCCCLDASIGNVLPVDWIYTPILMLYSNQELNRSQLDEVQQIFTIRNCLRWILIYETYFPLLASGINPTDRFCRLACVFLASDDLFLTKEIHDLLELCYRNVAKHEKEFDFDREIQGLSNFQNFYTQLLEQYQGVSYGDALFGNVILAPLAQKHDAQFRKTLWSEYMGAVQVCNVTPEQYIGDVNLLLEPHERDLSLLKCYRRAIVGNFLRKGTVLFNVAESHVKNFVQRNKQQ
ncbi:unnamed protein product [Phyllotreta striolata]|uniref:RNA polymerase II-associated protein 1 n=1 Tax=Phyllotreta striolata TaxID=444603 RepID=A0A9N9TWP2_PHYSR|nr:unnamed protein product [Phyllotreta striolata]